MKYKVVWYILSNSFGKQNFSKGYSLDFHRRLQDQDQALSTCFVLVFISRPPCPPSCNCSGIWRSLTLFCRFFKTFLVLLPRFWKILLRIERLRDSKILGISWFPDFFFPDFQVGWTGFPKWSAPRLSSHVMLYFCTYSSQYPAFHSRYSMVARASLSRQTLDLWPVKALHNGSQTAVVGGAWLLIDHWLIWWGRLLTDLTVRWLIGKGYESRGVERRWRGDAQCLWRGGWRQPSRPHVAPVTRETGAYGEFCSRIFLLFLKHIPSCVYG